jgi:hypothetical protein
MGAVLEDCAKCSGEGVLSVVVKDEKGEVKDKLVECECAIIKRLAGAMPPEVRMAQVHKAHAMHPITGMMGRSLFVKATYADMLSVIKAAIYKNNGRYVRTTSDAEIRNVGVGSTSRKARGEDAKDVYNDFTDLMESPPLVVVWLNKLGHKNRAAPGFLIEALTVRIDKRKPTWVVSDLDYPFGPGSFSYSDALWSFLNIGFQRVEIPRILRFDEDGTVTAAPAPVMSAPVARPEPKLEPEYAAGQQEPPRRERRPQISDEEDTTPAGMKGMGEGNKKNRFQRRH